MLMFVLFIHIKINWIFYIAHVFSFLCSGFLCMSTFCVVCPMSPMSLDCPFLIVASVFSDVCYIEILVFTSEDKPPVFSGIRVTRSLVLYVCFVDRCLSFCTFSFGHCVVCSSSIYGFRLPLWYLQTLPYKIR